MPSRDVRRSGGGSAVRNGIERCAIDIHGSVGVAVDRHLLNGGDDSTGLTRDAVHAGIVTIKTARIISDDDGAADNQICSMILRDDDALHAGFGNSSGILEVVLHTALIYAVLRHASVLQHRHQLEPRIISSSAAAVLRADSIRVGMRAVVADRIRSRDDAGIAGKLTAFDLRHVLGVNDPRADAVIACADGLGQRFDVGIGLERIAVAAQIVVSIAIVPPAIAGHLHDAYELRRVVAVKAVRDAVDCRNDRFERIRIDNPVHVNTGEKRKPCVIILTGNRVGGRNAGQPGIVSDLLAVGYSRNIRRIEFHAAVPACASRGIPPVAQSSKLGRSCGSCSVSQEEGLHDGLVGCGSAIETESKQSVGLVIQSCNIAL